MTVVRRADPTDIPWLLEQLRDFDRFFGSKHTLMPERDEASVVLMALITEHVFLIAAQKGGPRIGFIAGTLAPHPFRRQLRVLTEIFWWVAPPYRGTAAGAHLLLEFEHVGRQQADWVVMSLEERTISDGLVDPSSLERRGYLPRERSYLLEVVRADS